ncbi:hypothetical protein SAMN05216226_108147 [Halovenus aranensis]|jgi:hypothetical protein|uniref:Uncharacterized protein n=1 Tax=Halovenus aranensis TaxID=890420 RepID=A0A1G8W974_9EURY|nr:hypothetical protein [Halovenus aranensis]SDJ74812.1 hypothetical protein SAMN05216226_108147 [Halovenus aranensis]
MAPIRSVAKAILVSAGLSVVVLLSNPVSAVWATTEQLDPRNASQLWWIVCTIAFGAPVVGGIVGGLVYANDDRRYYDPFVKGGACAVGGLLFGILSWAAAGGAVRSLEAMFASVVLALCFVVFGGPLAFLVGGFTSKRVAWDQ